IRRALVMLEILSRRFFLKLNLSDHRVEEGKFFGRMVTKEGVRADPEKVQTIIWSPILKSPSQIRSLFLQLATIDKFIPKLVELKYTIRKEKMAQALIHITRSLRTTFRRHKVAVITDGPMEEILKLSKRKGRLTKWAIKIRTYDISYVQRKETKGSVVKKFFRQVEQVQKTPGANEGETSNLNKELQVKLIPTPRAWRLCLRKETNKEGSGVGIILASPDEKMHSYAIRLKFNASDYAVDCKALLAGLVASVNKGMK
nr:hypothetical protein [Tanacetum cinerariifolium]